MIKVKKFLKSINPASVIFFLVWLVLEIVNKPISYGKIQIFCEMFCFFLLPAIMIEFRNNDAFIESKIKIIKFYRNTNLISVILLYLYLVSIVMIRHNFEAFIKFSLLFFLPSILIEMIRNIIIRKKNIENNNNESIKKVTENYHDSGMINNPIKKKEAFNTKKIEYFEISIDGIDEQCIKIPKKKLDLKKKDFDKTTEENVVNNLNSIVFQNYEHFDYESSFFDDMMKFENKVGLECDFVPFMHYYPTYSSMNKQQKEWYFYWRSEIRNGVYLKTDLSYIFIYIYELLSGYGYKCYEEGYILLLNIWKNYRSEYPKLDRYLFSWAFDYTQLHNLKFEIPMYDDINRIYDDVGKNALIEKYADKIPLKLPFFLIESLCNYPFKKSEFCNDNHQIMMNEAISRTISLVDAYLYKKTGNGIIAMYGPNEYEIQTRNLFCSSNSLYLNKHIDIKIKNYINTPGLCDYLKRVVLFTENTLRELYNFNSRKKNIILDLEVSKLIKSFLKREYSPKIESNTLKKVNMNLNFESINELRNQSDAVRDSLEVAEETNSSESLINLLAIDDFFSELPIKCKLLLIKLKNVEWKIQYDFSMQHEIDKINEKSIKFFACNILSIKNDYLILETEYKDKLYYICENIDKFKNNKNEDLFDFSALENELKEFMEALSAQQIEIIYNIVMQKNITNFLDEIASQEMSMPEVLIDEINDIALQFLDNIFIDTITDDLCILEEYYDQIKKAII